jgi:uncharacterized membrane protein YfcA
MSFTPAEILVLLAGALLGGLANGLTGFGTALTAVPIWVHIMSPPMAAALGAAAGVTGQIQSMHLVWHAVEWRRVAPFILAGLAGVPIGTWALPLVDVRSFKLGVGVVLIAYCAFQLCAERLARCGITAAGGRTADALIGLGGGIMSGLAGLSGPLPIMWATLKPWTREEKRALFQTFNFTILSATVLSSAVAGQLPPEFWSALLVSVPGTLVGVHLGKMAWRRLDDRRYDRVVIALMLAMGVTLLATS